MKRAFALVGACVLLTSPALAQSALTTTDFVRTVAISDMFEVQSSTLALDKQLPSDKEFAQRMIHDHTKTTAQLKHLVNSGQVKAQLPAEIDAPHQQMLDQLRNETGANFVKDYDRMQLEGHREAVALFAKYAKDGDNSALKHWAAQTLPHLQEHLAMAEKLSAQ